MGTVILTWFKIFLWPPFPAKGVFFPRPIAFPRAPSRVPRLWLFLPPAPRGRSFYNFTVDPCNQFPSFCRFAKGFKDRTLPIGARVPSRRTSPLSNLNHCPFVRFLISNIHQWFQLDPPLAVTFPFFVRLSCKKNITAVPDRGDSHTFLSFCAIPCSLPIPPFPTPLFSLLPPLFLFPAFFPSPLPPFFPFPFFFLAFPFSVGCRPVLFFWPPLR